AVVQPEVLNPDTGLRVRPRTTYFYDVYGSLRAQTDAKRTPTEATGRDTTFRYDAYQRPVRRELPDLKASGTAAASNPNNGLTAVPDPNPLWQANQWQGGLVRLVAGRGAGQIREVVSSTNNTLTIAGTWDTNQTPDNSSQFVVSKGSSETSVYATQSL